MNDDTIQNEAEIFQAPQTAYRPQQFAIVALFILFVLYQFIGGGITLFFLGGEISAENVTAARLATMFAQILFLLIPTIYLAKRQHGKFSEVFRWRMPSVKESFFAVMGMIALMQLSEMYLFMQSKIPLPEQLVPIIEMLKKSIEEAFKVLIVAQSLPEMLFVVLVAALTPAICEEMMFRGLIQKNFSLAYGSKKGFIIAGTIFGLYHFNPFWLVPLIALGIYFSFLQHRSKTLLLPIAVHLMNNAAAAVSVYFYGVVDSSTPTMFLDGSYEPSVSMILGTSVIFGLIFYYVMVQYIRATETVHNER